MKTTMRKIRPVPPEPVPPNLKNGAIITDPKDAIDTATIIYCLEVMKPTASSAPPVHRWQYTELGGWDFCRDMPTGRKGFNVRPGWFDDGDLALVIEEWELEDGEPKYAEVPE